MRTAAVRRLLLMPPLILAMTLALLPFQVASAPPAMASLSCSYSWITINSGSGAEAPSSARGHKHSTGNHYIRYFYSDGVYEYWADNNGGWDGDTRDTFYGKINCG